MATIIVPDGDTGGAALSCRVMSTLPPALFPDLRLPTIAGLLRAGGAQWRAVGVSRVRVFGSVARGEADLSADIDLLVDFAGEAGLLDLMAARAVFEALLGRRVDVVTEGGLKAQLRDDVLADAVDVMAVPMPPPESHREKRWRWRVLDLLDALDRAVEYTSGQTLDTFLADPRTQDAVLRNLAQLGETTKFLPPEVQEEAPGVPWARLREVRNLISHDYFGIDPRLVWHTARVELPALRPAIGALADSGEP